MLCCVVLCCVVLCCVVLCCVVLCCVVLCCVVLCCVVLCCVVLCCVMLCCVVLCCVVLCCVMLCCVVLCCVVLCCVVLCCVVLCCVVFCCVVLCCVVLCCVVLCCVGQCGSALQDYHSPLPPSGVAVQSRSSTAHCPQAEGQCIAEVPLPSAVCPQVQCGEAHTVQCGAQHQALRHRTQSTDGAAQHTQCSGPCRPCVTVHRRRQNSTAQVRQSTGPGCTTTH